MSGRTRDCGHEDIIDTLWYGRDGRTMCTRCVDPLLANFEYKRVAYTDLDVAEVSTVWLGIDHGFGRSHVPLIFETMIFAASDELDQQTWRYPTEAAALAGHDQAVAWARARLAEAAQ